MESYKKTKTKNGISRAVVFAVAILVQIAWLAVMLVFLQGYSSYVSIAFSIIALIVALYVFGKNMNSAFKFPWLILILAVPFLGLTLYFITGHSELNKRQIKRFNRVAEWIRSLGETCNHDDELFCGKDISITNQSRYISNIAHYPAHFGSKVTYFSEAVDCMNDIIEEVRKAERFVFLEYHAIENSTYFLKLADVLEEKVKKGVEVRLIYDEVGSLVFINRDFVKNMTDRGINCRVFNPIAPTINVLMNNRDHRKITVIDGKVSYTGGFNLADEYFNLVSPYGYWKDTGVKVEGKATLNLTTIFLEMWNQIKQTDTVEAIKGFLESSDDAPTVSDGELVQPFADSPLDTETVGRSVYLNMISAAKKYIYISTPYLITDDETYAALTLAAGRGVDVRVLIPEIPDKKIVYRATCSYATLLAQNRVRIYKFKGGFNHAKQVVCDDEIATCGTINFDYRSLYFHFENGVLFTDREAVLSMKKDFLDTFAKSSDETAAFENRLKRRNILYDNIIRLISPLF